MSGELKDFDTDLFDAMSQGVIVWRLEEGHKSPALRLAHANRAALTLIGRALDRCVGMSFEDVFPSARSEQVGALTEASRKAAKADIGSLGPWSGAFAVPLAGRRTVLLLHQAAPPTGVERDTSNFTSFLDSIIEELPAMIFVKDAAELRFVRFNKAGEDLLGLSRNELIGKNDYDFFPKEQADFFVAKDREVLRNKILKDIPQEPIETPRGTRWLHTRKIPILDERGLPRYLLGVSVDITDQKKAEEILRASHEELERDILTQRKQAETTLRLILEGTASDTGLAFFKSLVRALAAALKVRHALVATRVNRPATRVQTLAWFNGEGFAPNIEYDLKDTPCQDVLAGEACSYPRDVQSRFPKDVFLVEMGIQSYMATPLMSSEGEVIGHLVVLDDKSGEDEEARMALLKIFAARAGAELQRMEADQTLRQRERDLEKAQAISKMGSWGMDPVRRQMTWSEELFRIYGYSAKEVEPSVELGLAPIDPEDAGRVRSTVERFFKGEETEPQEFRIRRPEGEERLVRATSFVEHDEEGKPARYFGTVQDITELREAETRLQETEDQLRQAQKMEAIGRLAGGVAHDFNNLLTAIMGYGQLLTMQMTPEEKGYKELNEILKAGDRAAGLTRQLLAFSRKQELQVKAIDLNELVLGIEKMLQRIIGEDVALEIATEGSTPWIEADPGQVEQVLLNLVVNARDAMPEGGRITISVGKTDLGADRGKDLKQLPPGSYSVLKVQDTGTGIAPDVLSTIFDPFFTTKGEKGTGLGLSTVYGIVKQSGGETLVSSELGKGTEFRVYLPLIEKRETVETTASRRAGNDSGSERILLVEDEPGVRALVRDVLQSQGYDVIDASSAEDALLAVTQGDGKFDLLLTDVLLPGMRGDKLARELKKRWPKIKVIHMSGYTGSTVLTKELTSKANVLLMKPFKADALARKIREVLDG